MTKADIVAKVAKSTGISKTDTSLVIEFCMKSIKDALQDGENVYLRKFGTFVSRQRSSRMGINIKTKKKILILPKKIVGFKPSELFFEKE